MEKLIAEKMKTLKEAEKEKIKAEKSMLQLRAKKKEGGVKHPITQVINEVVDIFSKSLGYSVYEGPGNRYGVQYVRRTTA